MRREDLAGLKAKLQSQHQATTEAGPDALERLAGSLFGPQRPFALTTARFSTALCSRRAGKTHGIAVRLLRTALSRDNVTALYITSTRANAKKIIWRTLKDLCRDYSVASQANETELTLTLPNGSLVYLAGAKDRDKIEDFRGVALAEVALDEAQLFPEYIEDLVDAVLVPALTDYAGSLVLSGTPPPVPTGYFVKATKTASWEHHGWTAFENPHLEKKSGKSVRTLLNEELARRGITEDDPIVRREWYGELVTDVDSLVFRFDSTKNTYAELPPAPDGWRHVFGIDVGFRDADAIVVIAFSKNDPRAFVVEERVTTKQTISALVGQIDELQKTYRPISMVIDEGGLGKKIAEEMRVRPPHIPVKAAEKTQKMGYIEILNDALRTGHLLTRAGSRIEHDARLVEWDRDRSTPDKRVISDRYHSDVLDALLYGFRESMHYLHKETPKAIAYGSPEWFVAESARMRRTMSGAATKRMKPWER